MVEKMKQEEIKKETIKNAELDKIVKTALESKEKTGGTNNGGYVWVG